MNHSRKFRKLIAAVLSVLCIVLCCTACGGNSNKPTPRPQNTATVPGTTELNTTPAATDARTTDGMNTAEPGTDSPAGTDAPDSEKPTEDGSGQIADFREGKVVKPEDVPEIRSAVEKEYPGYTIQSVTHALLSGQRRPCEGYIHACRRHDSCSQNAGLNGTADSRLSNAPRLLRDSAGCGGNTPGAAKKMFSGSFD